MSDGDRYHVPLILCCAEDNEVALVRILDALHDEGLSPEVISGVDGDANALAAAVDAADGPALFVLCQSDDLTRAQVRKLSGLFSARSGAHQSLVTVPVNANQPMAGLPMILNALNELARTLEEPASQADGDRVRMREFVRTGKRTETTASDPEGMARELSAGLAAAEALLRRRSARRTGPPVRSRRPASPRPNGAAIEPEPGAPVAEVSDDAIDPSRSANPSLADSGRDTPRDGISEELLAQRAPGARAPTRSASSSATRSGSSAQASSRLTPRLEADPPNRALLILGIVGIASLVVMAAVHLTDAEEPLKRDAGASERTENADARDSRAGADEHDGLATLEGTRGRTDRPRLPPPPPYATDLAETTGADPADAAVPPPTAGMLDSDSDSDSDSDKGEGGLHGVDDAIDEGKLRALDNLLVLPGPEDTMVWDTAVAYCRRRLVGGVGGWRLPTRNVLRKLARARLLPHGTYWSRTQTEAGDEAYAFEVPSGRVNVYLTIEPVAIPICVRRR